MGTRKRVVIFSCTEALALAMAARECIQSSECVVDLWNEFKWENEASPIYSIVKNLASYDGAVIIASSDSTKGKVCNANVLVEIGACYSTLGVDKTKILLAGACKLPTNLSRFSSLMFRNLQVKTAHELLAKNIVIDTTDANRCNKFLWTDECNNEPINAFMKSLLKDRRNGNVPTASIELEKWKEAKQITDDSYRLSHAEVQDFLRHLSPVIVSKRSNLRNSLDVLNDLCTYVDKFDDLIPASKLASTQSHKTLTEVWVFARQPLEFSYSHSSGQIWDNVVQNVTNDVKYRYYIGKNAESTLSSKLNEENLSPDAVRNFSVFVLPDHYFIASITLHFAKVTRDIVAFLSRQDSSRDDVLVQIEEGSAYEMWMSLKKIADFEDSNNALRSISLGDSR
jgi:hypothetical protein